MIVHRRRPTQLEVMKRSLWYPPIMRRYITLCRLKMRQLNCLNGIRNFTTHKYLKIIKKHEKNKQELLGRALVNRKERKNCRLRSKARN